MQEITLILPQEIYSEHLSNINGIPLSKREIDTIACILNGRTAKEAARLLSIAQKTVETHIYNVKKKFECSSLITLIEESGKQLILQKYYLSLLTYINFEKCLTDISKYNKENVNCVIGYWQKEYARLLSQLKTHLELVGIKTLLNFRECQEPLAQLIHEPHSETYTLYALSKNQINNDKEVSDSSKINHPPFSNLLFLEIENPLEFPTCAWGVEYINFSKAANYYFSFFELLKKLLPLCNFDGVTAEFRKKYELTISLPTVESLPEKKRAKNAIIFPAIEGLLKQNKWYFLSAFSVAICALFFGLYIVFLSPFLEQKEETVVRSDLILPSDSVLLNRSDLIAKIDEKLRGQQGIQTIALAGMGGAGKTTLARQYGQYQKANIIWELNAETRESLKKGFESLAQAVAKTTEDQKTLRGLQEIKNSKERDELILQFVKDHLSVYPNWFLIYDNVEKFSDIQKYFPQDTATWGQGVAILTTRDSNIQNNKYIHSMIAVGEMTPHQKLDLFSKIMSNGIINYVVSYPLKETKAFLEKIPSFPLDVSIAAHYLKVTQASYKEYLENLDLLDENFFEAQESLLKESGDYPKTRYSIITLSLNHLLKTHKDFADLLLFMSLLDSQNIPRDLLKKIKSSTVVDNFICHLNKYSLITHSSYPIGALSIHRSTQAIMLAHLTKILNLKEDKRLINVLTKSLEEYIDDVVDNEDFIKMRPLLSHAKAFLSHKNLLDKPMRASITGSLGSIYVHLGNYAKSTKFLNEGIHNLKKYGSMYSLKIVRCLGYLGSTYLMLGDYVKASQSFEQTFAIFNKSLSEDNVIIARVLASLGNVYRDRGDYKKALNLLEKSLVIYKKVLPENHHKIGAALVMLGNVHRALGNHEKAINLIEKGLTIYKMHFPKDHNGIAWVLCYLGITYTELSNYEKAKILFEESLSIYQKQFPEKHPWVSWVLTQLGIIHSKMGNYPKGIHLLETNLRDFKKTYGPDHIETARLLMNLGAAYLLKGNLETAKNYFTKASQIFEKNKHPDNYMVLEGLAELYLKRSSQEEPKETLQQSQIFKNQAISYLSQALEIVKTHFPKDSPHATRIRMKIQALQ